MPFTVYCEGSLTLNQPLLPRHRAHLELMGKVWRPDYYPERVFKVADLLEGEPFPDPRDNDEIWLDMLPWQVLEDGRTIQPRYQYTVSEWLRWLKYLIEDFLAPRGYILTGEMTYRRLSKAWKHKIRVEDNTIYYNARYIDLSPQLHEHLVDILLRYRLAPPERIAEMEARIQHLPTLLERLRFLLLEREVSYDAEFGFEDEDYVRLVQQFAQATQGEWQPEQIRAKRGSLTTIDFHWRGKDFHWEFEGSDSDYVDVGFYNPLGEFAQHHLSGSFEYLLETGGQDACLFYLPHRCADEMKKLIWNIAWQ